MGKSPFTIMIPASHKITITAKTSALYRQRVVLTDMLKAEAYDMMGQGEDNRLMTIQNHEPGSANVLETAENFVLPTIAHPMKPYREVEVVCSFLRPGESEDDWHPSEVWVDGPEPREEVDLGLDHKWVVTTEDGADDDRNDTVVEIVAKRD
ncbi:hypothetical protein QBC34DRAFT_384423 [Podospora aff. communis PSN243]|uniref:Uncharacterized protein n=1 Tax=Podospora aff. communis PSN243 TaxID=3040156 RepID=A0AAV9GAF6_9PEZI|nr:hypothetical protein QBC34DRAFT_384423 [Podospora aff. communis PSN243]